MQALSLGKELAGPIVSTEMGHFRNALGWNDIARARKLANAQNATSTVYNLSGNFWPFRLNFDQCLQVFNQLPWNRVDDDGNFENAAWKRLRSNLSWLGIRPNIPSGDGNLPPAAGQQRDLAEEWFRLIDMACQGPDLSAVIAAWHRSNGLIGQEKIIDDAHMNFSFQRAQVRKERDRYLMTWPFFPWTIPDAFRLRWIGHLDGQSQPTLLSAAGCGNTSDVTYAAALNRRLPAPETLVQWDAARLWDANIIRRLSLDDAFNQSSLAAYYAKTQGIDADATTFPDEPAGGGNFYKLAWRASRRLPSFAEAKQLQYRLRQGSGDPGDSVFPGVPVWTSADTRALLVHAGMPDPIARQLQYATAEPVPLHMLSVVLAGVLEQPSIKALAERLYPESSDWIKQALLDHGFTDEFCTLAEAALRQIAEDKHNSEMIASKKALRHQERQDALRLYEIGTKDRVQTSTKIVDPQYTQAMADTAMSNIDTAFTITTLEAKMTAAHEAYMTGQQDDSQIRTTLQGIGINANKALAYLDRWRWERTTNQKHQTTQEILAVMKAGLMSPAATVQRLTNLGWKNPDAIAEVALVQHEMQVSASKAAAAQQAHNAALARQAASQAQHQAQATQRAVAKAQATATKLSREALIAVHQKLVEQSKYFAQVHADNVAYAAAAKKNDQEKMDEELQKEVTAYHEYITAQIRLITEAPNVAKAIGPLDTRQAPGPQPSTQQPSPPGAAAGPTPTPPTSAGGNAQPPGP